MLDPCPSALASWDTAIDASIALSQALGAGVCKGRLVHISVDTAYTVAGVLQPRIVLHTTQALRVLDLVALQGPPHPCSIPGLALDALPTWRWWLDGQDTGLGLDDIGRVALAALAP